MQQYFKDPALGGKQRLCRIEAYFARKEIVDEIRILAHKTHKYGNRKIRNALACWTTDKSFTIIDDITGKEVEMYRIMVIWRESAYFCAGANVYDKFGRYEV